MSYKRDSIEFAATLGAEGVPSDVIHDVLKDAAALHRLAEKDCNFGLDERDQSRENVCQARTSGRLAAYGIQTVFEGDPRGAVVKLKLPSGKGNWFGDTSFYCVPTP